jgi:hypothetical protein
MRQAIAPDKKWLRETPADYLAADQAATHAHPLDSTDSS